LENSQTNPSNQPINLGQHYRHLLTIAIKIGGGSKLNGKALQHRS